MPSDKKATSLGERIKIARKRVTHVGKPLTQSSLAIMLGIAYPTLNKYEKGHRIPDAKILADIARITNCDPGWLLTGEFTEIHTGLISGNDFKVSGLIPGDGVRKKNELRFDVDALIEKTFAGAKEAALNFIRNAIKE